MPQIISKIKDDLHVAYPHPRELSIETYLVDNPGIVDIVPTRGYKKPAPTEARISLLRKFIKITVFNLSKICLNKTNHK